MSSNGDFVITWSSENQDGSGWGVYAQRYNVNGTSQGSEFRVNTTTTNDQAYSTIAIDDSGNFVIAWSSKDQDGNDWGVYGQRYNAIGTALGGEFRINTFTNKSQLAPSIAMDDVGNFIVTWSSEDQDKDKWGVYAKRFNSAGVVLGGEFRVNNTTSKEQIASSVAMASDGSFVVSWSSKDQDGDNWGVYAKRYNAAGIQQGSEFLVNSVTSKKQTYSSVAMDAFGNFAVSWSSEDQDGDNWGVYAKRFNSAGVAQGSEFQVNTTTNKEQFNSSISMDSDGDFVITWTSEDQDGSGRGIYARQFTSAGVAKGGETLVNSTTAGSQDFSSVSMDAKGNFVVAWSGNGASDTQGVFAKRFSVPTGLTFSVGDGTRDTTTTFRGTMAEINAVLDGLNFSPNTGFNGLATFTITTDDLGNTSPGGALVDSDVININVGNGNVAPSISLPGVPIVYTENDPATVIDGGIVVTDPDSVNFDGGQFVAYIAGNGATADRLVIRNQGTGVGQVGVVGSNVTYNFGSGATVIGSVVGGTDGLTPLEITFNANAIVVAVQSVARNITFENVSDDPGTLSRTVEFIISDGDGGVSVNQSTTISVVELNDIPTIAPQAFNIVENATNGTLVGVVVASDPDSDANGVLSFSISGGSGASAFSIDSTTGQITVADQSQLDFEATTSFALQVQVVDGGTPGLSVTATITINLLDANESPTDLNPNGYSVVENTNTAGGLSLGVLTAIDQDASESFTYSILAGGDGALFSIGGAGANELILTDGVLNFETKSSYSVTVRVLDSAGSSYDEILTVNVIDQDEIPVAAAGGPYIINEGNGVVLNGLASADPEGSALSYSWDLNNDGVFGDAVGATPSINWGSLNSFGITNQGIFAIGLRVADGAGNSNTTTTTLTVNNLAPTAINDSGASFTTSEDNLFVTGNVLLNDSDPNGNDALSIVGLDLTGTRGLVVYNGDGTFTYNPNGQFEALQLGDTAFDTFIYTLRDEAGATAFGTVTVSIRGVNDEQQLIINQNLIVSEGATQSFSSTSLITIDVDNTALELTYAITNGPARGFLSLNTNPTVAVTTFTQAQINSGVVIYVHNGSETLSDSFGFTVDDGMGSLSSGTFAITVSPVNDMPVSVADNYTASPGIAMIVGGAGVLQNDIDIDSTAFTAMVVSGPINGQLVLQVDGSFTYLPDVNFFGIDSFTYTVSDGALTSLPAMVRIEVAQPSPTITPSTTPFPTPTDGSESVVVVVQPEPVSTAAAQGQVQRTTQTAAEPASAIQVHSISTDPNAATGTITAEALESMVESEWLEYLLQASSRGSRFRVDGQTVLTEMGFVTQTGSFWESLDGFKRNAEAIATAPALMIGGSAVLATSISAGYLVWMIRGGQVLAAMMANLPAWQLMDPLPILGGWVEKDDETDKSLESLLEESTDSNVLLESNVTEGSPSVVAT